MPLVEELSAIFLEEEVGNGSGRVALDLQAGRCALVDLDHLPPEDLCGCDSDTLMHDLDELARKRRVRAA